MGVKNTNTTGIRESAKQRNIESIEGAKKAVVHFKRSKVTEVTAEMFAEKAKISVATIYNNDPIKEMWKQLKVLKSGKEITPKQTVEQSKKQESKDRVKRLTDKVSELQVDKADCIAKIAALTTENLKLKERLKELQTPVVSLDDHRNKPKVTP